MGIIQNAINQMIGTVGIAKRLSPGYELKVAEQAGEKQVATEKAAREKAAAHATEAYDISEKKLAEAEATLHGRSGENQYGGVLEMNKQTQKSLERAQLYNPTTEREQRLGQLRDRAAELEEKRQKALQRTAQAQETKRKQKEQYETFRDLFTQGGLYK